MITQTDIDEFRELYVERFGVRLNDDEVRHKLSMLVRQMRVVYRPVTKQALEEHEGRSSTNEQRRSRAEQV